MKILLVGSGINQVKAVGKKCTAIDISQEYLDKAKLLMPENEYIKADVQNMPFKDSSFDKVIFTHVLEHVDSPKRALSEIRRVLKKGGELYLEVPTKEMEIFLSKHNPIFKKYIYKGFHKTHYTKGKLISQLDSFDSIDFQSIKGKYIVFWYLWGKFITTFKLEDKFYIEECGQIHTLKYDKLTSQLSRLIYIFNILLSPVLFRRINCEYHVLARK